MVLAVLTGGSAQADGLEVGGTLGAHHFSSNGELGVADHMAQAGPTAGGVLGARVAHALVRRLAVEGELVVIPTKDDVLGERATVFGVRAHARVDLLLGRVRPFVVAGLGLHAARSSSTQIEDDQDRSYHWGGGVRYALSPKLDVRLDARHLLVPDRTLDGATSDLEVTLGVAWKLGGRGGAVSATRVASAASAGDRDRDGLPDASDQCATKPEDRDGTEDADGCPELDDDGDGIVDAMDRCPRVAETRNGWQDEDGCVDEVIAELTGIGFEQDSAKIDAASAPLLERAYQILHDHPKLSVEISGHTSADGNEDRNLELSLRRAEAVKRWLVQRGISADRILTIGHGSDAPIAGADRARNRRIEFRILTPADVEF